MRGRALKHLAGEAESSLHDKQWLTRPRRTIIFQEGVPSSSNSTHLAIHGTPHLDLNEQFRHDP
jgi:hypothetical protein